MPYNTSVTSLCSSPVPFLLGGVSFLIALIAFALIILLVSHVKDYCGSNSEENNRSALSSESSVGYAEKIETLQNIMSSCADDKQEKIVVIMAGDDSPTFIAKPASASAV